MLHKSVLYLIIDASIKTVVSNNREKFQIQYQAGKDAFERGQYRQSVEYLEAAREFTNLSSRVGGEAQMWLVTAYQAAGQQKEAVALAGELTTHPHPEIRQQAKRLLYIIQAPELKRPKEWMSEIPDLANTRDGESKYITAKSKNKNDSLTNSNSPEPVDLSQVDTEDNQFIWVALIFTVLTFIGLFWLK